MYIIIRTYKISVAINFNGSGMKIRLYVTHFQKMTSYREYKQCCQVSEKLSFPFEPNPCAKTISPEKKI